MAEKMPADSVAERGQYVDWSRYTDGSWWSLTAGEDFDQTPGQAAAAFRSYCWRRDLLSSARVTETGILVRVRGHDD